MLEIIASFWLICGIIFMSFGITMNRRMKKIRGKSVSYETIIVGSLLFGPILLGIFLAEIAFDKEAKKE